jgi:electron transfer flavoprotein alpha subunit
VCFPPVPNEEEEQVADFGGHLKLPQTAPRFLRACGAPTVTAEDFAVYGVPAILEMDADADLADYPEAQAEALARTAAARGAAVVLLPHNDLGASLAPGIAARWGGALLTEAVGFAVDAEGLLVHRRALGEQAVEIRRWNGSQPLVLTVDPKVMSAVVLPSVRASRPSVTREAVETSADSRRQRVLERIPPDPQTVDVSEAEVIFCAGKGFDPETFEQFQELSRLLTASLGVTRPVYDLGWAGFERMIGQTGKTVAPRFYLGMGISGSMHHVGGIKDSKCLISLNIDPKVAMFPNSDEGFVADIRDVLPLLLERVKEHLADPRAGAAPGPSVDPAAVPPSAGSGGAA